MTPLIRAENVTKEYLLGEVSVRALKGVSFEIYEGELIVILGPSGSGKSTLLNILGGIETVSSGSILYRGQPVDFTDPRFLTSYRRKNVGFVFQFYNLMPGLTALENIALASELGEDPLDPAELIAEVGLKDRAEHFPNRLSGGEQQRIAIARAICKNPDLLLCDEPTGALDSATGTQVLRVISDFRERYGKTVLLITHNSGIADIADRVFRLKDGLLTDIAVNDHPVRPEEVRW